VANTGPVIPPDQLGRLFRPFQRMDPALRSPGGLGLGLAIVSAIAAAHRADLRAVTRAAGGLAIEVLFPSTTAAVTEAEPRAPRPVRYKKVCADARAAEPGLRGLRSHRRTGQR